MGAGCCQPLHLPPFPLHSFISLFAPKFTPPPPNSLRFFGAKAKQILFYDLLFVEKLKNSENFQNNLNKFAKKKEKMLIPPSILLLLLLFFNAQMPASSSNHSFHVDLSQLLDASLRAGVLKSIEEIHGHTCLQFSIQKDDGFPQANVGPHRIRFVQSTPGGPCGLDSSFSTLRAKNATIYLNGKCAPANETETVSLRLLGLALTGQKTATNSVLPQINAHFNCPDNCPQLCQNGGLLSADGDCTCQCPFNGLFDGENCEELVKLGEYTDSACGPVSVENGEGGILKLSGRMDSNTYCQFLLRSPDPWARFRVDFLGLEMSRKAAGTVDCPDKLQVYGLASTPMFSVKCSAAESPKPGHTFVSASNFLLFQLEANRFDSAPRQGPIIHYVLERPEYSEEIRLLHPSDAHKSGGNSGNTNGHNGGGMHIDPSSHLPLAALLFVVAGVSVIVLILLALRRHSVNRVKRRTNANGGHHTPVPSSPTPPPANGNGGC